MNNKKFYLATVVFLTISLFLFFLFPFTSNKYHFSVPITLSAHDTPLVEIEIQKHKYIVEVDIGSKFQLTLSSQDLDKLKKKPNENLQERDAKGRTYESPAYQLESINLSGLKFTNVITKEANENYVVNTTLFTSKTTKEDVVQARARILGRTLLNNYNLLIDIPNSTIFISNNLSKLNRLGYDLKNMIKVPFEIGRTGIILNFNTDLGFTKLSLDTGSTLSLIRESHVNKRARLYKDKDLEFLRSSKFEIGSKDFGKQDLYLYDITSELSEIDGILGMDFLKNHVIYIDHKNKIAYL